MTKKLSEDLTQGSVPKKLLAFALPFLASNFLQAFYNVVDMLIVGKFVGTVGISGVNLGGQVMMVMTSLITGLTIGGTVLVAQYTGARQTDAAKKTVGTMFTLFAVIGVVMTIISLILCRPVLQLIGTPERSFESAEGYLIICITGIIFIIGYNSVSSIMRGLGDSKRPLFFVLVATILNVILDLVFVGVFNAGAAGAAAATTISQAVSFILAIWYLKRNKFIFDFKLKSFRIDKSIASKIIKIGIPSSIQMTLTSLAFLFIAFIINRYDVAASAASGIGGKIDTFAILPALAISSAISSMVGQNIGAKEYDRAKLTLRYGLIFSVLTSTIIFVIVQLFSEQFVVLFCTNPNDPANIDTIRIGVQYLKTVSFSYLILAVMFSFNGFATGSGNTVFTMFNTFITVVLLRVPLAWILSGSIGLQGAFLALAVSPVGGAVAGFIFYLSGYWKKSKLIDKTFLADTN